MAKLLPLVGERNFPFASYPIRTLQPGDYFFVPPDEVRRTSGQGQHNVSRAVKRVVKSDEKLRARRRLHYGMMADGSCLVIRLPDEFCYREITLPPPPYPRPTEMHVSHWFNDRIVQAFGKNKVRHYI